MNVLPTEKRVELKRLLLAGNSARAAARMVGCSKLTANRYVRLWQVSAKCGCGKPAGHRAWCWYRFQYAPKRQGFFDEQWKCRKDGAIYDAVREASEKAASLGHVIAMFVWTSGWCGAIAHTKCTVCGASGRLWTGATTFHTVGVEGRLVDRRCVTPAEREEQRKRWQEKREWQTGKRILREIKSHLRQSHSPRRASTPEPNLRA